MRKAYCFPQWAAATEGYDRLVAVDEPEAVEFCNGFDVPAILFEPVNDFRRGKNAIYGPRFNEAFQAIMDNAEGYTHIYSLDTDVIPLVDDSPRIMEENYTDCDFLCNGVPWRYPSRVGGKAYELGCTFGTVAVFNRALKITHPLQGIYGTIRCIDYFKNRDVELFEVEHLSDEPEVDDRD